MSDVLVGFANAQHRHRYRRGQRRRRVRPRLIVNFAGRPLTLTWLTGLASKVDFRAV
ncbi:MAG: hypothetical protein IPH55_19755 [Betaproteobacteria bacterium]|nr:hypothetical protein [Betaproteobacteria bacterium]